MMRLINSVAKPLALVLLVPALNVTAGELEYALKAALPDKPNGQAELFNPAAELFERTFELFKHNFGVQPAEVIEQQKGKHTLMGKLARIASHGGIEDVIIYRIIKEKGAIKEITWKLNEGEWTPFSEPMTKALGAYRQPGPMTEEKQREVESALEKAVDKTWQKAAEFLIAHIAIRNC